MDADFAKRWVERLRDPEISQAHGCLHDGKGYCCMGVAELTAGRRFIFDDVSGNPDFVFFSRASQLGSYVVEGTDACGVLTTDTAATMGMCSWSKEGVTSANVVGMPVVGDVTINGVAYLSLVMANDAGCTFPEIADWIENNWERL